MNRKPLSLIAATVLGTFILFTACNSGSDKIASEAIADNSYLDTIITYDPVTYKENIAIVNTQALEPNRAKPFSIVQRWSFNKETGQLASSLLSMAPLQTIGDAGSGPRFTLPRLVISFEEF